MLGFNVRALIFLKSIVILLLILLNVTCDPFIVTFKGSFCLASRFRAKSDSTTKLDVFTNCDISKSNIEKLISSGIDVVMGEVFFTLFLM